MIKIRFILDTQRKKNKTFTPERQFLLKYQFKMKIINLTILIIMAASAPSGFHQFSIQALNDDKSINLEEYKGKKVLVVNVASKCGYTKQYEDLQAFHEKYGDKVVVLGFPCNQFGNQEPGTEAEIQEFCSSTFQVSFPMTTKVNVKGSEQHPIYQWLTSKELNGLDDFRVSWNFNKFLIDEDGKLIGHFPSGTNPFDDEILKYIN